MSAQLREAASFQSRRSEQLREASAAAIARAVLLRTVFVARGGGSWKEAPPLDHLLFSADFAPRDRAELLAVALQCARRAAGTSLLAIQLRDHDGVLRIEAQSGLSPAFVRFFDGMSGPEYLRESGQVFIENVAWDARLAGTGSGAVLSDAGIVSIACTPIVHDSSAVIGLLSAYYREPTSPLAANLRAQGIVAARLTHWLEPETVER